MPKFPFCRHHTCGGGESLTDFLAGVARLRAATPAELALSTRQDYEPYGKFVRALNPLIEQDPPGYFCTPMTDILTPKIRRRDPTRALRPRPPRQEFGASCRRAPPGHGITAGRLMPGSAST